MRQTSRIDSMRLRRCRFAAFHHHLLRFSLRRDSAPPVGGFVFPSRRFLDAPAQRSMRFTTFAGRRGFSFVLACRLLGGKSRHRVLVAVLKLLRLELA